MINTEKFLTYFLNTFVIGILLYLTVSLLVVINDTYLFIFMSVMVVWALSFPIIEKVNVRHILKNVYKDYSFIVQAVSFKPSPGTSLIAELASKSVTVKDIDSMILMTCNLEHGCNYYDKKLKQELKEVTIDMYGFGKCSKPSDNITLHQTSKILEEHENIIKTKTGRFFVYYEPIHELVGKNQDRDELKKGAYLFELVDKSQQQKFEKFIKDKLKGKLKEAV